MNLVILGLQILGTLLGVIVLVRAIGVVSKMDVRWRDQHYVPWLGFGLSYIALALSAVGSIMMLWSTPPLGLMFLPWLCASGGLIVFDRRRRRARLTDPEATLPPERPIWMFWAR